MTPAMRIYVCCCFFVAHISQYACMFYDQVMVSCLCETVARLCSDRLVVRVVCQKCIFRLQMYFILRIC